MSTEVVTPSRAPAAPTSARMDCAVRPRRPMMRPMSLGPTLSDRMTLPWRSLTSIYDGGGVFGEGLGDELQAPRSP